MIPRTGAAIRGYSRGTARLLPMQSLLTVLRFFFRRFAFHVPDHWRVFPVTRRPRAHRNIGLTGLGLVALALGVTAGARPKRATAQEIGTSRAFNVNRFAYALGEDPFFTVDSAVPLPAWQFSLALASSYQNRPFAFDVEQGNGQLFSNDVVTRSSTFQLNLALGLFDVVQVGLALPMTNIKWSAYTPTGLSGEPQTSWLLADPRLQLKFRLASVGSQETGTYTVALAPELTLPAGDAKDKFSGADGITAGGRFLFEAAVKSFRAGLMLGVYAPNEAQVLNATVGSAFIYGVAASYRFAQEGALVAELSGASRDFKHKDVSPSEANLGLKVNVNRALTMTLGGGLGLVPGIGAPEFRGIFRRQLRTRP